MPSSEKCSIACSICKDFKKPLYLAEEENDDINLCEECYNEYKCSVCYTLIPTEEQNYKLFDNPEHKDCKVKLCKICCDTIKASTNICCPICRYNPNPVIELNHNYSPEYCNLKNGIRWINSDTQNHHKK